MLGCCKYIEITSHDGTTILAAMILCHNVQWDKHDEIGQWWDCHVIMQQWHNGTTSMDNMVQHGKLVQHGKHGIVWQAWCSMASMDNMVQHGKLVQHGKHGAIWQAWTTWIVVASTWDMLYDNMVQPWHMAQQCNIRCSSHEVLHYDNGCSMVHHGEV